MIEEIPRSKGKNNKMDKINELAEEEESLEDKNEAPGLQMSKIILVIKVLTHD